MVPDDRLGALPVRLDCLPAVLTEYPQWVAWHFAQGEGKPTKVPVNPRTGGHASATDPATWATFDAALAYAHRYGLPGVGFVFSSEDPFTGVDLDGCHDLDTGELEPWASEIVDALDSYTELSPSGRGVHVIVRGALPDGASGKRKGKVEAYTSARYFTVTGHRLSGTPGRINARQDALSALHARVFTELPRAATGRPLTPSMGAGAGVDDAEIVRRAMAASNGAAFAALFISGDTTPHDGDDSRADEALCCHLAFWTRDPVQIDRLFRRSALYRDKWERADYRERTIARALATVTERYERPTVRPGVRIGSVEIVNGKAVQR